MSAWMWDLCCFLIAILSFSRLRGLSKEGRGYPRRSCVGVVACRGNPGQEGRNQGRRANERVSGETLVSFFHLSFTPPLCLFLSSLFFCMSCSCLLLMSDSFFIYVFVFLCLPSFYLECVFWRWHGLPWLWQLPPGTLHACVCTGDYVCKCSAASDFGPTLAILWLEDGLSTAPLCSVLSFIQCVVLSNFWAKS